MLAPEICAVAFFALSKSGLRVRQRQLRTFRVDMWSIVRRNDANLASWALVALIAVELGRIVSMLVNAHAGVTQVPAVVASPKRGRSEALNVADIVSAHLFGISAPDPSDQDPANAPRATANLTLVGTIATQDPQRGKAIVGDPGQPKVYSVGQQVGGATLRWVYLDHVVLDRNGSLESLALPRANLAGEWSRVGARPAPQSAAVASARGPASAAPAQDNAMLEKIVDADAYINNGEFVGIRVGPAEDNSAFARSGLASSDIVIAVNGTTLTSADRGQAIWKHVSTGDTVTVLRWGRPQNVTLNFAP